MSMSERTSSSSRKSEMSHHVQPQLNIKNLRHVDLSNAEEFYRLKGSVLDEHLMRLILKSFMS